MIVARIVAIIFAIASLCVTLTPIAYSTQSSPERSKHIHIEGVGELSRNLRESTPVLSHSALLREVLCLNTDQTCNSAACESSTSINLGFGLVYVSEARGLNTVGIKTNKDLERLCNNQETAESVVRIYESFLKDPDVEETEKLLAKKKISHWKELAKQKAVRLGRKWLPPNQVEDILEQENRLIQEAIRMIEVGNDSLARDKLLEASRINTESIRADFLLGLLNALVAHHADNTAKHFKKCVVRRTQDLDSSTSIQRTNLASALNNLALAEVRQRKYGSALRHWEMATQMPPLSPELVQNLGRFVYLGEAQFFPVIPKQHVTRARQLYTKIALHADMPKYQTQNGWLYMPYALEDSIADKGNDQQPAQEERIGKIGNHIRLVGYGTGFVVHDKFIITNRHVAKGADELLILESGQPKVKLKAKVVALSGNRDLALVECKELKALPIPLSSSLAQLASEIAILGFPHPDELGNNIKVTRGSISGHPHPKYLDMLLYDATSNPGNSGGPVCNQRGEAVAIHAIGIKLKGQYAGGVPATQAIPFIKEHIPTFKGQLVSAPKKDWEAVVSAACKSTVQIHVMSRANKPAFFVKKQPKTKLKRSSYEDIWCRTCYGVNRIKCTNRKCSNGTVPSYRDKVVGRDLNGRRAVSARFRIQVKCPTCSGKGNVSCPYCNSGIDKTLKR